MSLLFFNQCTVVYCTHCDVISVRRGGGWQRNKQKARLVVGRGPSKTRLVGNGGPQSGG